MRGKGKFSTSFKRITIILATMVILISLLQNSPAVFPARAQGTELFTTAWTSTGWAMAVDLAWGDWDGDGDADLAVGNGCFPNCGAWNSPDQINTIYENTENGLVRVWFAPESRKTVSIAWGDWDGDGDMDLAVGNYEQRVQVYRNQSLELPEVSDAERLVLAWESNEFATSGVAWGDWDRDGDLDLAAGARVYENTGGALFLDPANGIGWDGGGGGVSIAWGDWDGDGDLDLAVHSNVYENEGGTLQLDPAHGLGWNEGRGGISIAWGDWDGDGDLDLAEVAESARVYENIGGNLYFDPANGLGWESQVGFEMNSVAWGDFDIDGDLDLAIGYQSHPNQVFINDGGNLTLAWTSVEYGRFSVVDWGDLDRDGDLDLAVGNASSVVINASNYVYENSGEILTQFATVGDFGESWDIAWGDWDDDGDLDLVLAKYDHLELFDNDNTRLVLSWASDYLDYVSDVAWGDWDGDGDLDLAAATDGHTLAFENVGTGFILAWTSPGWTSSRSVAWGDYDGDGDLDLAVGNYLQPNMIFRNQTLEYFQQYQNEVPDNIRLISAWSADVVNFTTSVAWGDWDGDNDLDLAIGNGGFEAGPPNRVYTNENGNFVEAWFWPEHPKTFTVAWGDWDLDGDLDLVEGNYGQPIRLYNNLSRELPDITDEDRLTLVWSSPEILSTTDLAWGDFNGDGYPDLAVGTEPWPRVITNVVYQNTSSDLYLAWSSPPGNNDTFGYNVAWGDWDRDNDLDLAVGYQWANSLLYQNSSADKPNLGNKATYARINHPGGPAASFYYSARILEGPDVQIEYELIDAEGDPARFVKAYYSLNGGSSWHEAVAARGTDLPPLAASPAGVQHLFNWDIYGSGIFGTSDNAIFRLDVYQGFEGQGPYTYPFLRSQTLPFRLRGNQIRVLEQGEPVVGAQVYRQQADELGAYNLYRDSSQKPMLTNPAGYLLGYGELGVGDKLVALLPVASAETYNLYYTSATPTVDGLASYEVIAGGLQTLNVSADNPLALFDLDVSLEWDARNDISFQEQLKSDLERTSELLYDWSNGQAALGKVSVYHDRTNWNEAHVRLFASNRLRPNADQGGIITGILTETVTLPETQVLTYTTGQVRMGAVWNRYGNTIGNLGEDWPRTLAHELGHYQFFLDDDYLGLDENDQLIPVDSCPGVMADPYSDDDQSGFDEFRTAGDWLPGCAQTLSQHNTARSDWQTIEAFYPWLKEEPANSGPNLLPLAVTQVEFIDPAVPDTTLPAPIFTLLKNEGGRYTPSPQAQAYLFQEGRLTSLGRPNSGQVQARGAHPGDRLCAFDRPGQRFGCEAITPTDEHLAMAFLPDWQPEVIVTPVTSDTIRIEVTNVEPGRNLWARLYPVNDPAPPQQVLVQYTPGVYSTTFVDLEQAALESLVHIWTGAPGEEIVTDYLVGGNPARIRSLGAGKRSGGARIRSLGAPVTSSDGQMILYGDDLIFNEGEFYAIQTAVDLPNLPAWATVVGQAYRLTASPDAPDLSGTSLSLSYMEAEVPPGEESWLKLYHYDGTSWQALDTQLDPQQNYATAPTQGEGLYVLMSTVEIPLYGPGWNNISYPILGSRSIAEALSSIEGRYTTVCRYVANDPVDPWRCYGTGAPNWVNDITSLEFGWGYWIYIDYPGDLTLRLKGASETNPATRTPQAVTAPTPPAIYYGWVLPGPSFQPGSGSTILAQINGHLCGEARAIALGDSIAYKIDVMSAAVDPECGQLGQEINFTIDGSRMVQAASWDDRRFWNINLSTSSRLFLPLLSRR